MPGEFRARWYAVRPAANRKPSTYRCPLCGRRLAAERGLRYLQVDASPDSRPILKRLGFAELAMTTPYVHSGRTSA